MLSKVYLVYCFCCLYVYCASKKELMIDLFAFDFMDGVRGYSVVLAYGVHSIHSVRQTGLVHNLILD